MQGRHIVTGIVLLFLISSIIPIASSNLINEWIYDEDTGTWHIEFSGELKESIVLKYGLIETSKVGVIYSHEYSFPDGSHGYIETSYNRGESWNIVKEYNESSTDVRDLFVSLTLDSIWIRFTVESNNGNGYWRIWDIDIIGDTRGTPPNSGLSIAGSFFKWQSYVQIRIEARDNIVGVKEIHYVLDGQETVIPGDNILFTFNKNGIYDIAYWAVDNCGNEEIPHIRPSIIYIDNDNPTVNIKSLEKGLYLFNKRMPFSINKTIIIGGFDIEVFAYDNTSGMYTVSYYLDGEKFNEAIDEPYLRYCGIKHNGKALLYVIAEDWAGNIAEDFIEIYYYNFF
jgi:hypothetical protein